MKNIIKQLLVKRYENKNVLILGFGKEGRSTYQLLRELEGDINIFIMDQHTEIAKEFINELKDVQTKVLPSKEYLQGLDGFDIVFKTPGLPGYLLNEVDKSKISSQSQLFMEYVGERCIGITGTKGKSTTSSIITHVLKSAGVKVKLIGNIGFPALESLLEDDGDTIYTYEMSSFQTEFLQVGPRIGVILNLFEEHLNNYVGYEAYQQSKLQLFKAQVEDSSKQVLVYGCDNHILCDKIKALREIHDDRNYYAFGQSLRNTMSDPGCFLENDNIVHISNGKTKIIATTDFSRKILGEHNLLNSLVAFIVIEALAKENLISTIPTENIIKALSNFRGLPHRLEEIGTYNNITFYNDSISTIPEATVKAVESIKNLGTLIIGGFDRKIGYNYFAGYLDDLKDVKIICLPETGHRIYELMKYKEKCILVEDMNEAVYEAYRVTKNGEACLLSPAAASYNQYKNFEERGDHFVECIIKGE